MISDSEKKNLTYFVNWITISMQYLFVSIIEIENKTLFLHQTNCADVQRALWRVFFCWWHLTNFDFKVNKINWMKPGHLTFLKLGESQLHHYMGLGIGVLMKKSLFKVNFVFIVLLMLNWRKTLENFWCCCSKIFIHRESCPKLSSFLWPSFPPASIFLYQSDICLWNMAILSTSLCWGMFYLVQSTSLCWDTFRPNAGESRLNSPFSWKYIKHPIGWPQK